MTTTIPILLGITPEPWFEEALCAQIGPDMADSWFPHAGDRAMAAKAVCGRCPVRAKCLNYALENRIDEGLWGGVSSRERRRLVKQKKEQAA